ncbi:hypothetical protein CF326_g6581 [Tilletia indica]|nr:hypothetical protein CF326_g6581 [Tilletia indica]
MTFVALAFLNECYQGRFLRRRSPVPKSRAWVDTILPDLDDVRFRAWVRMDRPSFAFLHDLIAQSSVFGSSARCPQAPVAEQLAIALHKYGTNGSGGSIRIKAGHWGQSEGHIINFTRRVTTALVEMVRDWIRWPNAQERAAESLDSENRSGLVGVIGKLDATDVVLHEKPGGSMKGEEFFNRKKRYGINLTAVCDHNLRFTFVTTGWPSSVHDSRVWANSDVATRPNHYFRGAEFLIADSAYPSSDRIVVPYKKPHSRVLDNKKFNKALSSVRIDIEHAFGLLKGRWASLRGLRLRVLNEEHMQGVCNWIIACCVLHNVLISVKDGWLPQDDVEGEGYGRDAEDVEDHDDACAAPGVDQGNDRRRRAVQVAVLRSLGI